MLVRPVRKRRTSNVVFKRATPGRTRSLLFAGGRFPEAVKLFKQLSLAPDFADFLTLPAYQMIV